MAILRPKAAMTPGSIAQQTAARVTGGAYGNVNNPNVVSPMGWGGEKSTPPPQSLINFMQQTGRGYMPNRPGWQNLYGGGLQSNAGTSGGSVYNGQTGGMDVPGGTAGFYGPNGGGFQQNQPQIPGTTFPNRGTVPGTTTPGTTTGGTTTGGTNTGAVTDRPFGASAAGPMAGNTNIYSMSGGAARQAAPFQGTTQSNPAAAGTYTDSNGNQAVAPQTSAQLQAQGRLYQPPVAAARDSRAYGGSNTLGYGDPNAPIQRDWSPVRQSNAQAPVRQGANSTATPNVLGNNAGSRYAAQNKQKATRLALQKNAQYPTAKTPVGTIKPGELAHGQALLEKQKRLPQLQESLRQGQITQEQFNQQVAAWDKNIADTQQNVQNLAGTAAESGPGREISRGGPGNSAADVLYRSQQTAADRGNSLMGSNVRQVGGTTIPDANQNEWRAGTAGGAGVLGGPGMGAPGGTTTSGPPLPLGPDGKPFEPPAPGEYEKWLQTPEGQAVAFEMGLYGGGTNEPLPEGIGTTPRQVGAEGEAVTDTPFGSISPGIGGSRTTYDPNTGNYTAEINPSVGSIHDPQGGFQNQANQYNQVGAGDQSGIRGGFNETAVGPGSSNQNASNGQGTNLYDPNSASGQSWQGYLQGLPGVNSAPNYSDLSDFNTGNDDVDKLLRYYQDSYNNTRLSNLERYNQILGGYGNMYENATQYQDQQAQDLLGGYQDRYDRNMGYIGDYGKQQAEDLTAQYQTAKGQEEQDLLNRGLGNTTVRSGVMRGLTESEADSQARLQEAITRMKMGYDTQLSGDTLAAQQAMDATGLGLRTQIPQNTLDFMERRTDEYPSLDQAIQLAMMSGQASGATQPGITGPAQPVMPTPGGGGGGNIGGGGNTGGGNIGGGSGYPGIIDPKTGLPVSGPTRGNSNPVRRGTDGQYYRWNPSTKKWEKVVGAEGSGETPTEETGLPTLPPEEPGTGSGEADPTVHTGLLYPGEGMERMVPPNSASQTAPPLPGNPQAAGIPGVTYSPTMENYDPRLLEQWARNRTAMLYPYLG